ncbi:MAG: hypothetical protein AAF560_32485 [Acidobacteriota bacterium]
MPSREAAALSGRWSSLWLAAAVAWLTLPAQLDGSPEPSGRATRMDVEPRIPLVGIHPRELAASDALAAPSAGLSSSGLSPGRFAGGFGLAATLPGFSTVIVREIPEVWQLQLPADVSPAQLDIDYTFHSHRGDADRMNHRAHPDSEIRVRVRPLPPRVVDRDDSQALIQGGVELLLDVAPAHAAGSYGGTLTATITTL